MQYKDENIVEIPYRGYMISLEISTGDFSCKTFSEKISKSFSSIKKSRQ